MKEALMAPVQPSKEKRWHIYCPYCKKPFASGKFFIAMVEDSNIIGVIDDDDAWCKHCNKKIPAPLLFERLDQTNVFIHIACSDRKYKIQFPSISNFPNIAGVKIKTSIPSNTIK